MKKYNQVEVIIYSEHGLADLRRKELVRWLGTTLQPVIGLQQEKTRKIFLRSLTDTPAIYMS